MRHIIGFGNELHGDDGYGPEVCRRLADLPLVKDVQVFNAATRGLDALSLFAGCEEAILLDAMAPGSAPGRLMEWSPVDLLDQAQEDGLHGGGLPYVLRALHCQSEALPKIRILTAEAQSITPFCPGLSPTMQRAVDETLGQLQLWLNTAEAR